MQCVFLDEAPITKFFGSKPMATLGSIAFPMFILHPALISGLSVPTMLDGLDAASCRGMARLARSSTRRRNVTSMALPSTHAVAGAREKVVGRANVHEILPAAKPQRVKLAWQPRVVFVEIIRVDTGRIYLAICLGMSHLTNDARNLTHTHTLCRSQAAAPLR